MALLAMGREAEIDQALARAVLARFLAGALAPAAAPQSADTDREAPATAALLLDGAGGKRLRRSFGALAAGPPPAPGARARLFGHTLRGAVCPYESEYGRRALLQQAHELADLAGFYEAFGLKTAAARRERPDHVACELEFLEFLSRKEAYALDSGDAEMLEVTRLAIGKFLRDHLGRFSRAFAASLRTADADGFYGRLAGLFEEFLAGECERFGVRPGPAMLELRSAREVDVPMACGSGDELVQIGTTAAAGG